MAIKLGEERPGLTWFLRIASVAAIIGVVVTLGVFSARATRLPPAC